jgi:hypothetical protein
MAVRVPKAEIPTGLRESMIEQLRAVPEPVEVLWHKPEVAQAGLEFGAKVGAWDAADESLKTFAHMAVAAQVGCSWCLDIGYFQPLNQNLDLAKASQVPRWRESELPRDGIGCGCTGPGITLPRRPSTSINSASRTLSRTLATRTTSKRGRTFCSTYRHTRTGQSSRTRQRDTFAGRR